MFFKSATAVIRGLNQAPNPHGQIDFYQKRDYVLIVADIKGLPPSQPGFFGFHIHEGNSCTGENFESTLSHYNPLNTPHPSLAGDLPPLLKCNSGAYCRARTYDLTLAVPKSCFSSLTRGQLLTAAPTFRSLHLALRALAQVTVNSRDGC